ncbi:HTTM domain-containing protein [Natrinema longum]|uniref:HTTM domain-containing protein n=1 Tax=Natrinema longum TaxID=370324 RepID=A0A8A2U9E5_9EURY|nr:HTTM domain-containing protein [Natrinema longum]MBZ6493408.1 HTTM domain-containing protein [Natrinema longum]QSW85244.1 HTTM domain-containing protein [Natrinema longum]
MTAAGSERTTTAGDGTTLAAFRALVRSRLGIDPRALAAFRIGLGLVVLLDLFLLRAPGLATFYTDDGVLPRSALAEISPTLETWSLHALSGSIWLQAILLAVTAVAAACLLVGYRHRLAAILTAALLASLYARNPYLVNGGDTILLSLLVLAAALPLSGRWAVRASRLEDPPTAPDRRSPPRVVSAGTAVLLLHIVVIYAINALLKFRSDAWMAGVAVQRIFQLQEFVAYLGPTVATSPLALFAINWLWIAVLSASVLLVAATGWLRIATVLAFLGAHLSMAATMQLGAFPFVMCSVLLVFLPPAIWERADRLVSGTCLERRLRSVATVSSPIGISPRIRRGGRLAVAVLLVGGFLVVVSWQVVATGVVDTDAGEEGRLASASWAFFAPDPPSSYGWYVVEADRESGPSTDLVTGRPVTFDRPPDALDRYPSTLWKRYGTKGEGAGQPVLESTAAYFCDRAPDDVESVTIYRVEQPVDGDGPVGEPSPEERIARTC